MAILAIKQGTTSTSALVIRTEDPPRTVKSIEHHQLYPWSGWVEYDAEELIHNVDLCIKSCDNLEAIYIENQGESCLSWNAGSKTDFSGY